ncbi:response regulator transcription factor [Caldichromatium japonicum]|uniref:Response regulator transcription factor n=1 Tax=Caldichromatium japonicum TaxID=2699430 RepID=A0A6G7VF26_9GAMM|nr:response regulator [Caldichromatium japonicum]QIK38584.1 response regulator transcription factor [Caldichromatium japonicum]
MSDRERIDVVLIVDDVPENLSLLHDALDEAGYKVLVATNGEAALARARQMLPDVILLDAVMPGIDGFEVARRLKADFSTQHIPIIFMTGLTETEHVVAAFEAGSTDYVTKPVRPAEVLARIGTHLRTARQLHEAAKNASIVLDDATLAARLVAAFPLTPREAEVLFWVIKGKTNKDIGEILDLSPRTVNKHLEHIFEKLGVETRTAAANMAVSRISPMSKEHGGHGSLDSNRGGIS